VKKYILLGAMTFALSLTAQATLIGDSISGSSTGMTSFTGGTVVVGGSIEFSGTTTNTSGGGEDISVDFDFGGDVLFVNFESDLSGGSSTADDFSVTFSDLDWVGLPTHILTGLTLDLDDPVGTGAGIGAVVSDHSFTLTFTSFEVPEFRELEIGLITEEDSGGPSNPIPEPATMVLMGMGLLGMAARHKK
jgi:hypothetical protein